MPRGKRSSEPSKYHTRSSTILTSSGKEQDIPRGKQSSFREQNPGSTIQEAGVLNRDIRFASSVGLAFRFRIMGHVHTAVLFWFKVAVNSSDRD
jgi:hypothetical protein